MEMEMKVEVEVEVETSARHMQCIDLTVIASIWRMATANFGHYEQTID